MLYVLKSLITSALNIHTWQEKKVINKKTEVTAKNHILYPVPNQVKLYFLKGMLRINHLIRGSHKTLLSCSLGLIAVMRHSRILIPSNLPFSFWGMRGS